MKPYRNIKKTKGLLDGQYHNGKDWVNFSGVLSLMKIGACMEELPNTAACMFQFMKLADGYGSPGFFPSGYDWSGIRDSSVEATKLMEVLADVLWAQYKMSLWPWER